jgi:hypothetical protein
MISTDGFLNRYDRQTIDKAAVIVYAFHDAGFFPTLHLDDLRPWAVAFDLVVKHFGGLDKKPIDAE